MKNCQYFIAECGGGAFLGSLMNKPCLLVNGWQYYGCVLPDAYILYKNIFDKVTGKKISIEEALNKFFWSNLCPEGYFLRNNSESQLLSATKELLSTPSEKLEENKSNSSSMIKYSWSEQAKSKLSSANYLT